MSVSVTKAGSPVTSTRASVVKLESSGAHATCTTSDSSTSVTKDTLGICRAMMVWLKADWNSASDGARFAMGLTGQ